MAESHYPIQMVARLTGLSVYVVRIWEQRYQAVEPCRTSTNRRRYSQLDIERLNLLRALTRAGHSISQVARLPLADLHQLSAEHPTALDPRPTPVPANPKPERFLVECLAATRALDTGALRDALNRATTALGAMGSLQRVVAPLAQTIGDLWQEGTLTAAHEHFASAIIRLALGNATKPFSPENHAPVLVVATPTGQLHELGALLVGAMASHLGWQVTYLGASLPAAEIAGAARDCRARAVALSLVYPEDDPGMAEELARLRSCLPATVPILVGGRALPAYRAALEKMGAVPVEQLTELAETLEDLRRPAPPAKMKSRAKPLPDSQTPALDNAPHGD